MASEHSFSAAILAGGKSRRFGKDKGLVLFKEKPLIQHVIDIAKEISKDVFIISENPAYQHLKTPVYNDHFKEAGPLGGLHAALKNCNHEHCFLLACDMPFIDFRLLRALADHAKHEAVVPLHKNMAEPLAGMYQKSALPSIEHQLRQGQNKMTDAIELLDHHWLQVDENSEFYNPMLFANINTREEWERLQ